LANSPFKHNDCRHNTHIDDRQAREICGIDGGEAISFDAAAQEFRRKNVCVRVSPTCGVDTSDGCCIRLDSWSINDAA
jgi:hypothetical protein